MTKMKTELVPRNKNTQGRYEANLQPLALPPEEGAKSQYFLKPM